LQDGDLNAVVRIGNDFVNNFYEVTYPLVITPFGSTVDNVIWPDSNNLNFDMEVLVKLKAERNLLNANPNAFYRKIINGKEYAIMGDPNLGEIRGILGGRSECTGIQQYRAHLYVQRYGSMNSGFQEWMKIMRGQQWGS
jgi:cell surface protein SprA